MLKIDINNNYHLTFYLYEVFLYLIFFTRLAMMWKLILQKFSRLLKNKIQFSMTVKLIFKDVTIRLATKFVRVFHDVTEKPE